ncbi:hypothetical protein [Kitasatospora sp. NPDC004289]
MLVDCAGRCGDCPSCSGPVPGPLPNRAADRRWRHEASADLYDLADLYGVEVHLAVLRNEFISRHGVRLFAVLAALVSLLITRLPAVPWEALLAVAAAVLGVGEAAQRHEDTKTTVALHKASPWDRAAARQVELTEQEAELTV